MKLVDLIKDILIQSDIPLKQGEIFAILEQHPKYDDWLSSQNPPLKVPYSALARCLTEYSSGSKPLFGVVDEDKNKAHQKYFFYNSQGISQISGLSEIDLHPFLVKFMKERFNVYCKTINALKVQKKKDKLGKWTNPDIVGVNPVLLNLNELFQNEVEKLGILSTKVMQFYSFELKLKIDKSNITECYFQAVSNSSWANIGYLVVGDLDTDPIFMSNLTRLNNGYGIGVIKLNTENPSKSEIIVSAREREVVDINFMNFLSEMNKDFYEFIKESRNIINTKEIANERFDEVLPSKSERKEGFGF
jgi:hypothetical protein